MSSLTHLKEHIQDTRRRCLVHYLPEEFSSKRKVEITLQNGVTAVLRVHECYPFVSLSCPLCLSVSLSLSLDLLRQVPNGVHIQSLSGGGGWSTEELTNAKKIVNGMCPSLLPDAVDKLMEVLGE
jgi:hypothetical protein